VYGKLLTDKNGNYYASSPYVRTNRVNPMITRDNADNDSRVLNISGTAFANLTPIKNFMFTSRFSYAFANSDVYMPFYQYYADYSQQAFRNYLMVASSSSHNYFWQWENFANYSLEIAKNHNLAFMLGTSYSESRNTGITGAASGTTDNNLGFLQDDPRFMYFAYITPDANKTIQGGEAVYTRKIAYFGRVNYSYKDTYLAQFSLRADAADLSVLPKNNRWGYFPAASLGWVISNEKFMQPTRSWLDHLKIRASWGRNGSIASLAGYMWNAPISSTGKYNFGNELRYTYAYAPTVSGNEELKWETSEQLDFGIDMRLLGNRLTVSADWFNKKTRDLIVSGANTSSLAGFAASPFNAGRIENKGIEVEIGWQDHVGDFRYGARANFSTLKNKVTKVADTFDRIAGTATDPYTMFEEGQPAWYLYGYKFTGVDPATGDPMFEDTNNDGIVGPDDKTYIGKSIPDFTFGLTLNAAWKGLDFLVFGKGVTGVDIFNAYEETDYPINHMTKFTEDRWTPTNTNATNPRAGANRTRYRQSSAYVFSGAFFKIKQIQLGYTFPKKLMEKVRLSNLRVYASLDDFFTFTSYPGYDPEVAGGAGSEAGVDRGAYPNSKKVLFGLNLTF